MDNVAFSVDAGGTMVRLTKRLQQPASQKLRRSPVDDVSVQLTTVGEGFKTLLECRRIHTGGRGQQL
jgi:hypothetical protein